MLLINMKAGDVYKNKDPYKGEGELIVTAEIDDYGNVLCIHANHVKHPVMNGGREWKHIESLLAYYEKVD